jgi:hypothetical protein
MEAFGSAESDYSTTVLEDMAADFIESSTDPCFLYLAASRRMGPPHRRRDRSAFAGLGRPLDPATVTKSRMLASVLHGKDQNESPFSDG